METMNNINRESNHLESAESSSEISPHTRPKAIALSPLDQAIAEWHRLKRDPKTTIGESAAALGRALELSRSTGRVVPTP